jgi:hypothetical protein
MLTAWGLPVQAVIENRVYDLHADFRDVLEVIGWLQNQELPEFIRWQVALGLFYKQDVAPEHSREAMAYLGWFLTGGNPEGDKPGPKLLDWEQDAAAIISDVNKTAGQEIRALPFLHWWTFLSWFHGIGEGQVSALVSIRDKLQRGKKLEGWEKEFYRQNRDRIQLKKKYSPQELLQRQRLEQLLG